jgi:hypothetical protein
MPAATVAPDHTRYRKLVNRVFTVRAVEQLRARAEAIAQELLDALEPAAPVDLISSYCALLPVTVIAEILGWDCGPSASASLTCGSCPARYGGRPGSCAGTSACRRCCAKRASLAPDDIWSVRGTRAGRVELVLVLL